MVEATGCKVITKFANQCTHSCKCFVMSRSEESTWDFHWLTSSPPAQRTKREALLAYSATYIRAAGVLRAWPQILTCYTKLSFKSHFHRTVDYQSPQMSVGVASRIHFQRERAGSLRQRRGPAASSGSGVAAQVAHAQCGPPWKQYLSQSGKQSVAFFGSAMSPQSHDWKENVIWQEMKNTWIGSPS